MTTNEAKVVIAEAIQRELDRQGLSWYRLGLMTEIPHATMSHIRNSVHDPKASTLKTIADALGVKVDDLLTGHMPQKSSKKLATVA